MNSEMGNLFVCGNPEKNCEGKVVKGRFLELLSNCDGLCLSFHHQYPPCLLFTRTLGGVAVDKTFIIFCGSCL